MDNMTKEECSLFPMWLPCATACCDGETSSGYSSADGPLGYCVNGQLMVATSLTDAKNCTDPFTGANNTTPSTWSLQSVGSWISSSSIEAVTNIFGDIFDTAANGVVTLNCAKLATACNLMLKQDLALDNERAVIDNGGVASCDVADIPANTQAVIDTMVAIGDNPTVYIPPCVYVDWCLLLENMPAGTVYDHSGYDAKAGAGVKQSYVRIIQKTNSAGTTNGNTQWLTADYHPAHVSHVLTDAGDAGARASFVAWQGTCSSDTQYGAQWTQDFVGLRKMININGYDNTANPAVATRLQTIIHPNEPDDSGAHGFGTVPTLGTTYEFLLAGLSTIANYLTKDFIGRYKLPANSTGCWQRFWQKGNSTVKRWILCDDLERSLYYDANGNVVGSTFVDTQTLATYGHTDKIIDLSGSSAVSANWSHGVIHNLSGPSSPVLPPATPGLTYEFWVMSNNSMVIYPNGTDRFRNNTAGDNMFSSTLSSHVQLKCIVAGVWEIVQRQGTWGDA